MVSARVYGVRGSDIFRLCDERCINPKGLREIWCKSGVCVWVVVLLTGDFLLGFVRFSPAWLICDSGGLMVFWWL